MRWTEQDISKFWEMKADGASLLEIADRLGRDYKAVQNLSYNQNKKTKRKEVKPVIEEPKPVVTEKARSEFDLLTDAVSGKDAESIRKAIDLVMQSGLAFDCLNVALNSRSASIEIHFSERVN